MSSAVPAGSAFMSIGEVLAKLRPEFPDVTISKIRFLESEGLIQPRRSPSGYRKFSHADVERLRYVLTQQRDHYLPLRVIKEQLDLIDKGIEPRRSASGRPPRALVAVDGTAPEAAGDVLEGGEVRLTRAQLLESAGITEEQLTQLEDYGLVTARGSHFDGEALTIARVVVQLGKYGLEPRHLRLVRTAAERELGLVEQIVLPLSRQRNPEARARAEETAREITALMVKLHAALVKAGLRDGLIR